MAQRIQEDTPKLSLESEYDDYVKQVGPENARSFSGFCQGLRMLSGKESAENLEREIARCGPSKPFLGPGEEPDFSVLLNERRRGSNFGEPWPDEHNRAVWEIWNDPTLTSNTARFNAFTARFRDHKRSPSAVESRYYTIRQLPAKLVKP